MARRGLQLIAAALLGATLTASHSPAQAPTGPAPIPAATPSAPATPAPGASPYALRRKVAAGSPGPAIAAKETLRQTFESLTPEQRERFKENLLRWTNMTPEEKKALRDQSELRRTKMAEETDKAVKESGLTLTPEQREQFAHRYTEGRRLMEEKFRRETEEKRKPAVRELVTRLREEFSKGSASIAPSSTN